MLQNYGIMSIIHSAMIVEPLNGYTAYVYHPISAEFPSVKRWGRWPAVC
jgi:hypothetical protein